MATWFQCMHRTKGIADLQPVSLPKARKVLTILEESSLRVITTFQSIFPKECSSTKNQNQGKPNQSQGTHLQLPTISVKGLREAGKILLRKSLVIKSLTRDSGSSSHLSLMPIKHSQQEVPYMCANTTLLKGTQ